MNAKIDHIVYCVDDMDEAIRFFQNEVGVSPIIGGKHIAKGTHNAILSVGQGCYLEILAVDAANSKVTSSRWMGVDLVDRPTVTRWCLKSSSLHDDSMLLQRYNGELGMVTAGLRELPSGQLLKWQLSEPLSSPAVDIVPFLIDWSESDSHPTFGLPVDLALTAVTLYHPNPTLIQPLLDSLRCSYSIQQGADIRIAVTLIGPRGEVEL